MKRIILSFLAAVLLFAGCAKYSEVDINDIKIGKVKMLTAKEIDIQFKANVDNPTGTAFEVLSIDGVMFRNGVKFATMQMLDKVVVPAASSGDVVLRCRLSLEDHLAALAFGLNLASLNSDDFTVDLTATVKGGIMKKSFRYKDVPISQLLKQFDVKL